MRSRLRSLGFGACALVAGASGVSAAVAHRDGDPRVWQSDVKIESLDASELKSGGPVNARIIVAAAGDDPARSVRLEVLLPIGVGVLRLADGCKPSPSPVTGLNARVTCEIGDIPARGSREISIATSARPGGFPLRFAVFALSDTPDPAPANNFAERVVQ